MTIHEKIINEKLPFDINRQTSKISGKVDKYEYLAGEQILPSDKSQTIEQTEFTFSSL